MSASKSTPAEEQESTDDTPESTQNRWEEIGKEMLQERLECVSAEVSEAFHNAAETLADNGELSKNNIDELRFTLEQAQSVTNRAAESSPNAEPVPDIWTFLGEEERESYIQAVEGDQN